LIEAANVVADLVGRGAPQKTLTRSR